MAALSAQLHQEAAELTTKLDWAEKLWHDAVQHQAELSAAREQWGDRLAFACAEPLEPLSTQMPLPVAPDVHTVLATDGSQIAPSHHEIAYCYLINVGRVALHYGSGVYPLLDSQPELFYKNEDWQTARRWNIPLEEWLSIKRTVAEAIALAELAETVRAHRPQEPMVAFSDGSLVLWPLEAWPAEPRDQVLQELTAAWARLQQVQVPLVGYTSVPRAIEATNFLRLQACPFPAPDCRQHCGDRRTLPCSTLQPLRDATLGQRLLPPHHGGPLWQSHSAIAQRYPEPICFRYLHVGVEVVRLEMPHWVAMDSTYHRWVLALTAAQVQKGMGYPVALAEAHHQAVVTAGDRHRFFALLEQEMQRAGLHPAPSRKEARKRHSIA
ncbi:MAG: DNA double-strand break repair nuclease NurA [Pseudanabaenaceae cyanobacterium]